MVTEVQSASPSSAFFFMQINDYIMNGTYYKAMKIARELIEHERELIENVTKKANP